MKFLFFWILRQIVSVLNSVMKLQTPVLSWVQFPVHFVLWTVCIAQGMILPVTFSCWSRFRCGRAGHLPQVRIWILLRSLPLPDSASGLLLMTSTCWEALEGTFMLHTGRYWSPGRVEKGECLAGNSRVPSFFSGWWAWNAEPALWICVCAPHPF